MDNDSFDYIIIGGGNSGCLLASRLATAPACHRILLVEAGDEAEKDTDNLIPGLVGPNMAARVETGFTTRVPRNSSMIETCFILVAKVWAVRPP